MIYNATLLRNDLPSPNPPGADVAIRCALTQLSASQERVNEVSEWDATRVIYIPLRRVPSPRPVAEGRVLMRADGESTDVTYDVKQVIQRNGQTLGHIQVYVKPVP